MPKFSERLQHAWNAFRNNKDPTFDKTYYGYSSSYRPDRIRPVGGGKKTIVNAIKNRIAVDCAAIPIRHVRTDENGQYVETIHSSLNDCLNMAANDDQTGTAFIQDAVFSLLDEGCIAIVPTDTNLNPNQTAGFDVEKMRVGKITQWFPDSVKTELYNEKTGKKEEIVVPKKMAAIIENPFYAVMNSPNSTLQRLDRKLNLLDITDDQVGSGKLNMVIQLPYAIKTEMRRNEAEKRRKDLENQLENSKYGVGYIDATEKLTQLNRSIENNFLEQVEYLTKQSYAELSMTENVMNGTANEQEMLNYYNRTINPILTAIVEGMKWKFLTKTARTQLQSIMFFRDPFELVPVQNLADIADKFTRNEILTSNEFRSIIGFKPSDDPNADMLRNKNMPIQDEMLPEELPEGVTSPEQTYPEEPDEPEDISQIPISQIMNLPSG